MMTMMERVAKAIATADEQNGGLPWQAMDKHARRAFLDRAEAALKELREPTDAMIDAGAEARERLFQGMHPDERRTAVISPHPAGTIFVAMIDQAITEA